MTPRNLRQEQEPVAIVAETACMEPESDLVDVIDLPSDLITPNITPVQIEKVINLYLTGKLKASDIAVKTGLTAIQCRSAIKRIDKERANLTSNIMRSKLSNILAGMFQAHDTHTGELVRMYVSHQVAQDKGANRQRDLVSLGREITKTNEAFINMIKGMGVPEVIETSSNKNPTSGSTNIKNLEVYPDDSKLLEVDTIASLKRQLRALEKKEAKEKD